MNCLGVKQCVGVSEKTCCEDICAATWSAVSAFVTVRSSGIPGDQGRNGLYHDQPGREINTEGIIIKVNTF